jgi:carbonic anhydrase
MSKGFEDVLAANEQYAQRFTGADLTAPAARGLAVVTCMDSRIDPLQVLGLGLGDAKVLRNPGGRVTPDVLTALVVATHLLGVERVLVMEHTDCGMTKVTDEQAHEVIRERSGIDARSLELGTIGDQRARLAQDVQRVRSSPYLPTGLPVLGCLYDVRTGRVEVVVPPEE